MVPSRITTEGDMERRDFLKMGGAVGVGASAAAGAGCVPGLLGGKQLSTSEINELVGRMDDGLERASRYDMLDDFARRSGEDKPSGSEDERAMCSKSLRALYATAMFRSLPIDAQVHPAIQQRMLGEMPAIDEAVFGMTDFMAAMPQERREGIRKRLKRDPDAAERISQGIDLGAGKLQLASTRRFQMRSMFKQAAWRLQTQSTTTVIDEYVRKVEKVQAQLGTQTAMQRRVASQLGDEAYWRYQDRLALAFADDPGTGGGGGASGAIAAPPGQGSGQVSEAVSLTRAAHMAALDGKCNTVQALAARVRDLDPQHYITVFSTDPVITNCVSRRPAVQPTSMPVAPSPVAEPTERTTGQKMLGAGGWMMGIGMLSGLGGLGLASLGDNGNADGLVVIGVISVTVGVLLLISGFVVVLLGALVRASE